MPLHRRAAAVVLLGLAAACERGPGARPSASPADSAVTATDDAGRTVTLPRPARRIVALVPSLTEMVVALGAADRLAGRTDFDTDPAAVRLPSVGGGLDPSIEKLVALHPDLVLSFETSGRPELRDRLTALGIPVFSLKTEDTTDVYRAVRALGRLTGRGRAADSLSASLRAQLDSVRASVANLPRPSVLFVVWNDPPMTTGRRTFVSQLIGVAGGRNAFDDQAALWPSVSLEEIVRRQPDVVVVPAGEQAAMKLESLRSSPGWRELRAFRDGRAAVVPSDLVNRPGPRMGQAAKALRDAIHPQPRGR